MRLAVWDGPACDFLISGRRGDAAPGLEVVRGDAATCVRLLDAAEVDVALLPSLTVLRRAGDYDVVPAVALSSWSYPYARLVLKHGLEQVRSVALDPRHVQEAMLTRIVLREHYRLEPTFVPYETAEALRDAPEDAVLHVGADVAGQAFEGLTLDLGQEWYELANYPMVWGVFAARKGETDEALLRTYLGHLRRMARAAEAQRAAWVESQNQSVALRTFFADDVRVRLDDLAIASLTELRQFMYYYDVLDEVPDVPLLSLPSDEEEEDEDDRRPNV